MIILPHTNEFLVDPEIRAGDIQPIEIEGRWATEEMRAWMESITSSINGTTVTIDPGDTEYTTGTGNEIIICDNTATLTITLTDDPSDGQVIKIKRRDALVTVESVNNIDGSASQNLNNQYDGFTYIYTDAAGEWGKF